MKEKVNFISKSLGIIEILDNQIKNFQIIEDSSEWINFHGIMFQRIVNERRSDKCYSFFSYKCKHFEIFYNFDEEGFLSITNLKF